MLLSAAGVQRNEMSPSNDELEVASREDVSVLVEARQSFSTTRFGPIAPSQLGSRVPTRDGWYSKSRGGVQPPNYPGSPRPNIMHTTLLHLPRHRSASPANVLCFRSFGRVPRSPRSRSRSSRVPAFPQPRTPPLLSHVLSLITVVPLST